MVLLLEDVPVRDADVVDGPVEVAPALPEFFEVLHGTVREVPPMSEFAGEVAHRLNRAVLTYLNDNSIGECVVERLFRIPQPDDPGRNRRPDVAYVSYARCPADRPYTNAGNARDVVPEIATEVVSPTDFADELLAKVRKYLRGGVRLVWVIYPKVQEVHAYTGGENTVRVFTTADVLDAGDILPGFRTPVGPLFPPVEPG